MEPIVENSLRTININKIAGIDEVGRGALSGSVVVACVMLPPNHKIKGLNDSKKISPAKREKLSKLIHERALSVVITELHPPEIDKINILNATKACMVESIKLTKCNPDIFVIDGSMSFLPPYEIFKSYVCLPRGDTISENVAAASICAKVYRDNYMKITAHSLYPQYRFDKHVGYGTKQHIEALNKYGPCSLHRMSFSVRGVYIKDIG